jgi:hypothetical protein
MLLMATGATLNLNFPASTPDAVSAFSIDGVLQSVGTWGALGSTAAHQTALITGTGLLFVTPYVPPVAGDFNNDGKVDTGDYLTWRKNYGTNQPLPNDNGLGTPIGMAHLNFWRQRYGNTPASGSGTSLAMPGAVPEPGAALPVLLGVAAAATYRRRRGVIDMRIAPSNAIRNVAGSGTCS